MILISAQSLILSEPICNIVPHEYGSFYLFACATAVSGFFLTFMMLSVRIYRAGPSNELVPTIVGWSIILMGLLCLVSFVAFNLNGVCVDVLG